MKKRVVSLLMTLVMLFSLIPSAVFAVNADPAQLSGTMVADPSTLNGWETYFGLRTDANGNSFYSTEYAGAVWSDKTVLTQVPTEFPASVKLGKDNFLVALSALASNSEIVGYSSIPTDTILVLDMSSSMSNAGAIDDLAVAANNAIKALYAENRDNRVGIVQYSSTSGTNVLMPLDRYTSSSGNYVEYYTSGGSGGVRICRDVVKDSNGNTVNNADTYHTGTFTQDGVYTAMKQLLAAEKTVTEGIQAGRERMPIMVLMTDGEPTRVTPNFNGSGATLSQLTQASGKTTNSGTAADFLTQLTAAYAKYMLENDANGYTEYDLLFYTLGFDMGDDSVAVLQPERTSITDTYWNSFLNGNNVSVAGGTINSGSNAYSAFRAKLNSTAEEDTRASINRNKYRYYVDRAFEATGAGSLNDAFQTIVQEIILQSRYSPTLVAGSKNMSGYLTMSDKIGEFMEVKNINGILLGDTLFTGGQLTRMMATDMFGNSATYTEAGWELVNVVSERIGIDQAAAIDLLRNAWTAGQLRYTSDTDFSNYIGFYEAADGTYKGFYDESYGAEDHPEDAKYITRAYGFYGPTDGSIAGSNMLHIVVRLRTEIETGRQEILFKIPSALIPVVTYDITITNDNLDDPGDITLAHNEEDPIRLLFEVGLDSGITELNVAEKMEAAEYDHNNGDGTYSFYSNRWGSVNGGYEVDYDVPLTHLVTDSQFHPSEENERYYFTENTLLCVDTNGTPYTGAKPTSGTFYHARRVFKTNQASDGSAFLTNYYVPVSQAALAALIPGEGGTWYIPKDFIRQETTRFQVEKTDNTTGTLNYSYYPLVDHPEGDDVTYDVYKFHGNNGKLTVAAATGIRLTKTIDGLNPDTAETFEFVISLTSGGAPVSGTYRLTKADGSVSDLVFTNGQAKVSLKHGETVYITGLSAGTVYTVTETAHAEYLATSNATGTLAQGELANVSVVNVKRGTGSLAVTKYVTHPLGSGVQIDKEFTVQVTLTDPLGQPITGQLQAVHSGNSALTSVTADASGKFTTTLKAGQTLLVHGLLEGSTAKVEEDLTGLAGFTNGYWEGSGYDDGVVTIAKDVSTSVTVHNHYTPAEVYPVNVTVEGEKIFTGRAWKAEDTFTFQLQKYVDGAWVTLTEKTITGTDANKTYSFNLAEMAGEKFTAVGEYTYQVVEVIPDTRIPGVTYDRTIHNFDVLVTDENVDGQLEIKSVTSEHGHEGAVTGDSATGWTVNADFTNTYGVDDAATAAVSVDVTKSLTNPSGSPLVSLRGWQFGLYESIDATTHIGQLVTTDAAGKARFIMNYGKADVGQNYTYYIKEVAGSQTGVGYSMAVYEVSVAVSDNGAAGITAAVTTVRQVRNDAGEVVGVDLAADAAPAFTNTYNPGSATLDLTVTKQLHVAEGLSATLESLKNAGKDFAFVLYDVTDPANPVKVEEVKNDKLGNVDFASLTFVKVGEYSYRLSEVIPNDADKIPGITYDPTVYHFHVHVEDKDGQLTASAHVDESAVDQAEFTFTNSYSAAPVSYALGGTKVLLDNDDQPRQLTHGMFEFVLYAADGTTEIERTVNSTAGTFGFTAVEYTKTGAYTYVVKEVPGSVSYIHDDTSVYTVTVNVTDTDFDGKLEIGSVTYLRDSAADEAIDFVNRYVPAPTTVYLSAEKVLENRALADGEFRFLLYRTGSDFAVAEGAAPVATVLNDGKNVAFGGITYSHPGVYYYVIKEDPSYENKFDVSYDATAYRVTVVIFDNGDGTLGKRVTYNNGMVDVDQARFTNIWNVMPGQLTITKKFVVDGHPGEVLANLPEQIKVTVSGAGYRQDVYLTAANGWTATVTDLPHGTYTVTEDTASAMVKDFTLTGVATDKTSVTFDNNNQSGSIAITNTYTPDVGDLVISKHLTHELPANTHIGQSFTVRVTLTDAKGQPISGTYAAEHSGNSALTSVTADANGQFTVELKAGDTLDVKGLRVGTRAKVEEIDIPAGYTTGYWEGEAYDDGAVSVTKDAAATVVVHNHYEPKEVYPVNVTVEGEKILSGRKWLSTDSFTVQLQKFEGGVWKVLGEKKLTESDKTYSFNLAEMAGEKFTAVGEYTYQVVELIPAEADKIAGVTYDRTIHNFDVVVTDQDFDGQLEIADVVSEHGHEGAVTGNATTGWTVHADFTNIYGVGENAHAAASVDVQKILNNPTGSSQGSLSHWQFGLYTDKDATAPVKDGAGKPIVISTDAAGEARFIFNYSKADLGGAHEKVFTYYVKEVNGGKSGVTYSDAVYEVKVTLKDDTAGGLHATVAPIEGVNADGELVFTNTYAPAAVEVPVTVTKKVNNGAGLNYQLEAGQFSFELYDITNKTSVIAKNDANGNVTFASLKFDKVGEYSYRLHEVIPADSAKIPGITYDGTVYHFHVHVEDNGGKLSATTHLDECVDNSLKFTFTNTYSATPDSVQLSGTKVLENKWDESLHELNGYKFTFGLYAKNGTLLAKTENDATGRFAFDAITFDKPGTYEYEIREIPGTLEHITYDDDYYKVSVEVKDNKGQLEVTSVKYDWVEVTAQGAKMPATATGIVFTNTYEPAVTSVQLTAAKTLANRELKAGEFGFLVYEADANFSVATGAKPFRSATNSKTDAQGNNIVFDKIDYAKPGTYYYVVCENASYQFQSDIGYDTSLYGVKVEITDSDEGELKQQVTFFKNGETVEKVRFANVWYQGALTVEKKFAGDLPENLRPEAIKVIVAGPDGYSQEIELTADNNWSVTLSDLKLGTYTVVEDTRSAHVENYWFKVKGAGEVALKAEDTVVVTLTNDYRYIPETGDFFNPVIWAGVAGVSLLGVPVLLLKRKKEEEEGCAE